MKVRSIFMVLIAATVPAHATLPIDGVLSLTPVVEHSCIATAMAVPDGQALVGLRWYHNDAASPFVRLLIMEAERGVAPDVTRTELVLEVIEGESLAWGEVAFSTAVQSPTGWVYAVFELPAFQERVGEGPGGGPGLGYRTMASATAGYLSPDGFQWVRLGPQVALAVEGVFAVAKAVPGGMEVVGRPEGWWSGPLAPGRSGDAEGSGDEKPTVESSGRPRHRLVVSPNPFNPRTDVRFTLSAPKAVTLSVYDLRGKLVRHLVSGVLPAGAHDLVWEGDDARHERVASGVYSIQLTAGDRRETVRVVLVR